MNLREVLNKLFTKKKEPVDEGVYIKTNLRCPKCKSGNLYIDQQSTYVKQYDSHNGKIDLEEWDIHYKEPFRLDATCCDCDHQWTVRNKSSILELDSEPKKIENGKS